MFENAILGLFGFVVLVIAVTSLIDLWDPKRQISNVIAALLLICLGSCFILMAIAIWFKIVLLTLTVGGKEIIGVYTEDLVKVLGAVGLGTAGMAIITGGFSLIVGGKYELKITSSEPIEGVEIKKPKA